MIRTLPLTSRDRLAAVILAALHDAGARRELAALAAGGAAAAAWLGPEERAHASLVAARAASARAALAARPPGPAAGTLAALLDDAAVLWEARCYFEVHELLEPAWRSASPGVREALQGLVQVAVGYQHLANGNTPGARALLSEGSARLHGRRLGGADLEPFARAVARGLAGLEGFDWTAVPGFPRSPRHG
ncbi:MAG TPA: hypothetical protein DDZ42_20980 [Candidatus Rokubacteria bacterium]|nr:MAG: hypothetical protein A2050_02680 [Candidatus Rokubacteria bacterium GWA2_73_35]HBH04353.1 hypothetical protein [Candidatus Rokubacteria bacterium]